MSDVPVRAIDKVLSHYRATKGKRHSADTAWGFKLWFSPWTLGEKDRVFGDDIRFRPRSNARLLIVKAEDEGGNRLFSELDEAELLNEADPAEIERLAGLILKKLNDDNAAASEGGEDPKASAPKPAPDAP